MRLLGLCFADFTTEIRLLNRFRLEPEWLAVVTAALAYAGEVVLAIPGAKLDAAAKLANYSVGELVNFKHIERPKDWNVAGLKELFQLLGLEPSRGVVVTQGGQEADRAVQELTEAVLRKIDRLVVAEQKAQGGFPFWSRTLLTDDEARALVVELGKTKAFLESLQAYTSPGKLKNFRMEATEVASHRSGFDALQQAQQMQVLVEELSPFANYFATAEAVLPAEHPWASDMKDVRDDCLARLADSAQRAVPGLRQELLETFGKLKKQYIAAYLSLHGRATAC